MEHEQDDLVLPGEVLCTYEEFIPSDWTYIEDGRIKASIPGYVDIDHENKQISVKALNPPVNIRTGDHVIGYVTEVKQFKCLITIKKIVGQKRDITTAYKGYIHISQATDNYVTSMHELFKIGDIIEAEVIKILTDEYIELDTTAEDLGVIKAMCVSCRRFMSLDENNTLQCECKNSDSRKISNKYGRRFNIDENY